MKILGPGDLKKVLEAKTLNSWFYSVVFLLMQVFEIYHSLSSSLLLTALRSATMWNSAMFFFSYENNLDYLYYMQWWKEEPCMYEQELYRLIFNLMFHWNMIE